MPAKKKLISLLFIIGLLISLFLTLILVSKRQDIRKRAGASEVKLSLYPATENIPIGSTKTFDLIATFTGGSSTEKLDYLKTEISFSKEYLKVPADKYVMTDFPNQTNFTKIFRVDGSQAANDSGRILIELGAATPSTGPPTDKPLTVARIYFEGVKQTPSAQDLTIGTTQIINNQSSQIPPALSPARYTVDGGIPGPTSTPDEVKANLLLSASNTVPDVGSSFSLLVSLKLTNSDVKISAADFVVLYEKEKLTVEKIEPATTDIDPSNPFTEATVATSGDSFDSTFNFLRVAEAAKKATSDLPSGTISLAKVLFRTKNKGLATIKFPADNKYFQITGIR